MTNRSLLDLLYTEQEYINYISKLDKEFEKTQQEINHIYDTLPYDDDTPYNKIDLEHYESKMKEKMAKRNSYVNVVEYTRKEISAYLHDIPLEYPICKASDD